MHVLFGAFLTLSGCAAQVEVTPETQVAAAVQTLATEADDFRARRRELVKNRQALLGEEQAETALLTKDVVERQTIWKLTKDTDRLETFNQILGATKASGEAWSAYEALVKQQAEAVAAADTKFALSTEALGKIVQALNALGTPATLEEQAEFYMQFLSSTKAEVEEQLEKATVTAEGNASAARAALCDTTAARAVERESKVDGPMKGKAAKVRRCAAPPAAAPPPAAPPP
jgi:hypothetical protein